MLCLVALLVALIAWAVTSADSGKSGNSASGEGSHPPATTITPGPAPSGPFLGGRPGGSGSGSDGSSGDGATGGDDTTGGGTGGGAGTSSGGGPGAGSTGGSGSGADTAQLPAGSSLPDCVPATVSISLRSVKNSYEPYDRPRFTLVAANGGSTACKLDFAPTSAVFAIDDVDDKHIWASDDCPAGRSAYLLQVPANGSTTYTMTWDRKTSSPQCATPKGQPVPNGATYLVEVKLPGFAARQTSFFLKNA